MNKYKAVLFDYDGTVADSNQVIVDSWQYMAGKLLGTQFSKEEIVKTFGLTLKEAMFNAAIEHNYPSDEEHVAEMMKVYRSYQFEKLDGAGYPEFPGMVNLIKKLYDAGIKLGIVTSRGMDSLVPGLKFLGVEECFSYLVTCDTTDIHKPNPEPALLCCKGLGEEPKDCLMVGDSRFDIACGNNAGCESCFVSWSFSNAKEDVEAFSPATYYVDSAEEILDIVL